MKFLQKDPAKRIEIADALKHPWIQVLKQIILFYCVEKRRIEEIYRSQQSEY